MSTKSRQSLFIFDARIIFVYKSKKNIRDKSSGARLSKDFIANRI